MPAPAFYLRLALLPLVLFACRTRDNPAVCTAKNTDCDPGFKCDLATETCVPDSPTDVGRPETRDGPVGGMAGTDGPATDAGSGGCTTNAGCTAPDKPICSPAGKCVTCTDPSHCAADPNKPACVENACISCLADPGICGRLYPATPLCSGKGACVECNISPQCTQPSAPICLDGKCTRCTSDSQCQDRNGANPGLCLAHIDGTCAKDADVIYVRASAPGLPCVDTPNGGTADLPFCRPRYAIEQVASDRRILLLRGQGEFTPFEVPAGLLGAAAGKISVIGQPGAVILPGAEVGVSVAAGDVFLRGLTISGGTKEGVVVQGEAIVRLYQCVIKRNALGGLRATDGAGYEVVNSIFDGNGPALLDGKTPFGAAYLNTPLAGRPGVFRFNTVVDNMFGVTCGDAAQQLSSSLFYNNGRDPAGEADVRNCATVFTSTMKPELNPDPSRPYQLTDKSPCVDQGDPVDHPPDDWKGEPRPGGMRSDCGADELHQEPAP